MARYAYIDALRGFAALWVVLYHLWNRYYPSLTTQAHPILTDKLPANSKDAIAFIAFGFGYTGVTLFFVLSGLCIHLPQARRGEYRVSARRFARRRFWRLYPAYLASIVLSVLALLTPKLLLAVRGRSFDWWGESQVLYAMINAAFLQPIWPKSLQFNGVYWTLVYEVQFYAVYPALLWCLRTFGFSPVGSVLLAAEIYFAVAPPAVPYLFPYRYFEWFLGVIAAEVIAGTRIGFSFSRGLACFLSIAGLGGGIYSTFHPVLYPFRDLLLAVGYLGLILLVAGGRGLLSAAFRWPVLVSLGIFSYSLYLVHVPIIDLVWIGIDRIVAPRTKNSAAVRLLSMLTIPLCLAVSYVFYRLFEEPFLNAKDGELPVVRPQSLDEKAAP